MISRVKKIAFILYLFCSCAATAQDKLPSFGKISVEELEMKDCDFDPGAEAVVLLDIGEISFTFSYATGWQYESWHRVRIKILKPNALDRASIKLRYTSKTNEDALTGVSALSCNLNAEGNVITTRMEQSSIYNTAINKESSVISFAIPEVKVGTVFEYKYKTIRRIFGYIPGWNFQQSIPVKYSAYNLLVPEEFQFTVQSVRRQPMERIDGLEARSGTWYIMRNVPGLSNEPFSTGKEGYFQRVEFQLSKIETRNISEEIRNSWPKIIDELLDDEEFGRALKKEFTQPEDLAVLLTSAGSNKEKIRIIYKYVQQNMQWDGKYNLYSDHGLKAAWNKKAGNIADINFILVRFLKNAGIDASPIVASTKDNGYINTIYPFLYQFNCIMAYARDGDEIYVMNAADKYNPYYLVPFNVLYTNALLVDKTNGGLRKLDSDEGYSSNIFLTCVIETDGNLSGQATLTSSDYARNIRMNVYKNAKLKAQLEDNGEMVIHIDSLHVANVDNEEQPLIQKLQFNGKLTSSGEYLFLPFHLFTGIGKNKFMQETRVMDIDFDFPKNYIVSGSYIIDEAYMISELPKNVKMIMPDSGIILIRTVQQKDNIISFRYQLDFTMPIYSASNYPYIKEFFKKMYNILDEKIVLKKK